MQSCVLKLGSVWEKVHENHQQENLRFELKKIFNGKITIIVQRIQVFSLQYKKSWPKAKAKQNLSEVTKQRMKYPFFKTPGNMPVSL